MGLSTLHICAGILEGGAPDPKHYSIDPTETWLWKTPARSWSRPPASTTWSRSSSSRARSRCRAGWTSNTAVLRKPKVHVERDGEHFVPFW